MYIYASEQHCKGYISKKLYISKGLIEVEIERIIQNIETTKSWTNAKTYIVFYNHGVFFKISDMFVAKTKKELLKKLIENNLVSIP